MCIMMTAGVTMDERVNDITMISVTPNYAGDQSGLWVTEQPRAPRKGFRLETSARAKGRRQPDTKYDILSRTSAAELRRSFAECGDDSRTCRRRKYPGVSLPSLMIMSDVA